MLFFEWSFPPGRRETNLSVSLLVDGKLVCPDASHQFGADVESTAYSGAH